MGPRSINPCCSCRTGANLQALFKYTVLLCGTSSSLTAVFAGAFHPYLATTCVVYTDCLSPATEMVT